MIKRIRFIVINYLTRNLLKALTVEDVLLMTNREWVVGKHKLSQEEIIELREEAIDFEKSTLYLLIKKDLKYGATLQRYDHAKSPDDMLFGKAMSYCISQIELFIKNIKSL